jgi:hypothetical protein
MILLMLKNLVQHLTGPRQPDLMAPGLDVPRMPQTDIAPYALFNAITGYRGADTDKFEQKFALSLSRQIGYALNDDANSSLTARWPALCNGEFMIAYTTRKDSQAPANLAPLPNGFVINGLVDELGVKAICITEQDKGSRPATAADVARFNQLREQCGFKVGSVSVKSFFN